MMVTTCRWCGCEVDGRAANDDGDHPHWFACKAAMEKRLRRLVSELEQERAVNTQLRERLECCRSCPANSPRSER